jgi:hypothetical protein
VFRENRHVDRNQEKLLPPLPVASTLFARRWRMARIVNDRASHSITDSSDEYSANSQPVSRKPVEVDPAEDRRQSSYDDAPKVLSLRGIRDRQCSGEVSASELDVDIEMSRAGEAVDVAEQEAPAVETSSAQRCNPANRFSAILECVRIVPTALVE